MKHLLPFAFLLASAIAGCSPSAGPQFVLNLEGRDPAEVRPEQRKTVAQLLGQLFGTPDEPKLPDGVPLDLELLRAAAGPVGGDAQGRQFGLYRRHCAGCHGTSGDGAGPAASILDPYPRDYRQGIFKYTSTSDGAKPTDDDLERTILWGAAGTAMPSFAQLPPREIAALVEYVKYLSIRGQAELTLVALVIDENERVDLEMAMEEAVRPAADSWRSPARKGLAVVPPPRPATDTPQAWAASVAKGRELYLRKDGQCVKCHGPEGAGDGEEKELYDDWNKPKKGVTPEETQARASRFTLPIQVIRPRDFRKGVFRGGSRPEDLYWRICVGIKGTPMPAAGPARSGGGAYAPEEIWPLVDYIRSLSSRPEAAIESPKSNATRPTSGRPVFPAMPAAGHGIAFLSANEAAGDTQDSRTARRGLGER